MENNDTLEVIRHIPLDKLRPYPDHPFGVLDDDTSQLPPYLCISNAGSKRYLATIQSLLVIRTWV